MLRFAVRAGVVVAILWLLGWMVYARRADLLAWPARQLLRSDTLEKADLIVVLAGETRGERILRGAQLFKEGWAPQLVMSGPMGGYEIPDCVYAFDFAKRKGYDSSVFGCVESNCTSTQCEAKRFAAEFAARKARTVILVTTDFHTRRAATVFEKESPGVRFIMTPAKSPDIHLDRWWADRDSLERIGPEFVKSLVRAVGF